MFKEEERIYLSTQNNYLIEKEILNSFSKEDLKNFIKDWDNTYMKEKLLYNFSLWRKFNDPLYKDLWKMDKNFIEQMSYIFHWWEELDFNKNVLEKFKRHYKINYEKSNFKNHISIDIKSIPIKEIMSKYINLPNNLKWNIKCCFHKDKSPSLKIYEWNNSWYCFGCQRWWWIVEFISEVEKCSKKEAFMKIIKLYS